MTTRYSLSRSKLRWCRKTKSFSSREISNSLRSARVIGGSRPTTARFVELFVLVGRWGDSCARCSESPSLLVRYDDGFEGATGIECLTFLGFSAVTCLDKISVEHMSIELRLLDVIRFRAHAWGSFCRSDFDGRKFSPIIFGIYLTERFVSWGFNWIFFLTRCQTVVSWLDYLRKVNAVLNASRATSNHLFCEFAKFAGNSRT